MLYTARCPARKLNFPAPLQIRVADESGSHWVEPLGMVFEEAPLMPAPPFLLPGRRIGLQ